MNAARFLRTTGAGQVLPLVMLAIVFMMTLGIGFMVLGLHSKLLGVRTGHTIAARTAADAALTRAIYGMNQKLKVRPWIEEPLPQGSDVTMPNSEATYDYVVTNGGGGGYAVQTAGKSGHIVRQIRSTLRLRTPFEFAIFTKDGVELKNSTVVDGYNFDSNDRPLQVGTNSIADGAIILKSNAVIDGDVVVGPGGDAEEIINLASGARITGSTYALTEEYELPSVVVPPLLLGMSSSGVLKGQKKNYRQISVSGKYDRIDLGNSEGVVIVEPVVLYVIGKVELGNSAEFQIGGPDDSDNDASLILYIGGNLDEKNGSVINLTMDAKKFKLFGLDSCQSIDFKNSSNFCGAIYAPNAYVDLKNSSTVRGAVIAEDLVLKSSANFHYDALLRKVTVDDDVVRFVIKRWNEQ